MKKVLISIGSIISLGLPALALAASSVQFNYLNSIFTEGSKLLRNVIIFLISLAVVWFIWNVVRYTMADDEGGKEKAKNQMVWGIIAIAVIVSIWGIVALLRETFGANNSNVGSFKNTIDNMIPGVQINIERVN